MTTQQAINEYSEFIQLLKNSHLSELPTNIRLEENEKTNAMNKFFADVDVKANLKADELLNKFQAIGDRAVLSNQFLASFKECNEEFKNIINDWNRLNENNPIEGGFQ